MDGNLLSRSSRLRNLTEKSSQGVRIKLELTDFHNLEGELAFKMLKSNTGVHFDANSLSTFDLTCMPTLLPRLSLPCAFPSLTWASMTSLGT